MPFLIAAIWGAVSSFIVWLVQIITKFMTRSAVFLVSLVALLYYILNLMMDYLSSVLFSYMPADYSHLMESVLPDHFKASVIVVMSVKIVVFIFDFKDKFLEAAGRIF